MAILYQFDRFSVVFGKAGFPPWSDAPQGMHNEAKGLRNLAFGGPYKLTDCVAELVRYQYRTAFRALSVKLIWLHQMVKYSQERV